MATECFDLVYVATDGQIYYTAGELANCTIAACPIEASVYGYRPWLTASCVLIALYFVCLLIQLFYGLRYKTWGFAAAMVTGCICEILGYVGRIMMWQNPWHKPGFTMQIGKLIPLSFYSLDRLADCPSVLITIGPVFFSAAIYVLLSLM